MRTIGLALLFFLGALTGVVVGFFVFWISLFRGVRAFHPRGSTCRAEVTALDDVVGPRLAGAARVRLSPVSGTEDDTGKAVIGLAMKLGDGQDLPIATFEAFLSVKKDREKIDPTDYLHNEYASVTPWRVRGLGIVWFRVIPVPDAAPKSGTRRERLEADIAAGRAKLTLEARTAPGPHGPLRAKLAELRLVERLPDDERAFRMSMFRRGCGLAPTGFRNGIRAIVYPMSQLGRRLRGG